MNKSLLVNEIEKILNNTTPGWNNTTAINDINSILNNISGFSTSPLNEKISGIRGWIDILYSPRKSDKFGGVEEVKSFILNDCASLKKIIKKIS